MLDKSLVGLGEDEKTLMTSDAAMTAVARAIIDVVVATLTSTEPNCPQVIERVKDVLNDYDMGKFFK